MKTKLVTLALMLAVASADVSHLTNRYLPPNYHMQNNQHGMMMMMHHPQQQKQNHPSNERVETTIEQHEVIELPTQIEIIKDGQPIYGVQRQPIEMARMGNNNNNIERITEISGRYLAPSQEIQDLQPPQQVPYEMPMREYLPPVEESTTTDMPTTTMMPPTTTYNPMMSSYDGETTTEQQLSQEEKNNYVMTTEMPTQEPAYETTTTMPTMPEHRYLPPMPTPPQNHYLPPMNMMMLPPPEPMPQPTYQQYQEQMLHEQQMQQMYREQEMQEMMNAIAEMQQQQMITLEPTQSQQQQQQLQPVAPVEPAHILRDDGYHYKTSELVDDVRRFRYRH